MAQLIKLKRSAVAGKIPTTGSLTSGEIAINTVDGKLFYRRDDDTIQSFFTTNALITGSLQQSGSDSYFLSNVGIGTDTPLHLLHVNGIMSSSDSYINDWGSISASLAQIQAGAVVNLQQVTDVGNITTNQIIVGSLSSSGDLDVGAITASRSITTSNNLRVGGTTILQSVNGATTDTDKFLVLDGDVVSFRTGAQVASDIGALTSYTETQTLDDVTTLGNTTTNDITAGAISGSELESAGNTTVGGALSIGFVDNATIDADKFLVLDNGVVKGRTGEQVASDIGAITVQPTLQNVAAAGNTVTGSINIGIGTSNPTLKLVVTDANEYKIRVGYPYSGGRYLDIGYQAINVINPGFNGDFQINIDGDAKFFVGPNDVASSGSLASGKNLFIKTLANATTDTNKFLVGDFNSISHEVKYRTGAQVLSDIGGASATINLQDVTDNGNVTTNDIIAATLSGSALDITGNGQIDGNLVVGGIVTAQEFHTEFVSASIIYQSGSTKFGDTSDDKHAFTGSVSIKDVPNADGDRDKFLVIDATGKIEYRSGSQVLGDIGGTQSTFDGNRGITQTLLPSLLNFNPGTATVEDFLDAVFYPPSPEDFSILSNEPFSVLESDEDTDIVHASTTGYSGAQAEFSIDTSAIITWSLQSTTIFSINSTTGRLSLNTDLSGSATFQAPKTLTGTVVATSSSGSIKTAPFTVTVVENAAPTITFQTISPNNNKTSGATGFGTITITDLPQGVDTVSIDSLGGADASSFTLNSPTEGVTTVYILSSSAALNSGSYSLNVTGSDSYDNVVSASFTVSVAENFPPVITQTGFSSETTQATSGSNIGTITVTDLHDSITAFSFTGTDAALFNPIEISSTATSKTFNVQPFNDLAAGSFNITGSGTDAFGFTTLEPIENAFTLPVPGTPGTNGSFSIIESAESGSAIFTNANGFNGTVAKFTTNQPVVWTIEGSITNIAGDPILAISQSGELSIQEHLSGSSIQAGDTLAGTVRATNTFGEFSTANISVAVRDNVPATITNNVATTKKEAEISTAIGLGTVVIADPQLYENVQWINFNGGGNFVTSSESPGQSVTYEVSSSGALTNGTYTFAITASDSYGQLTKQLHTLVVSENLPPTINYTGFTGTVADATSGSNIGTATVVDPDSEGIASFTLTGTDAALFNAIQVSSNSSTEVYNIQPFNNLSAGTFNITGSAEDDFGLTTNEPITNSFTLVPPAPIGSNDPFFIIESELSGSFVSITSNGVIGTKAKFTNTQPVTWSLQNTNQLSINQLGELSVKVDLSGSIFSGTTLTGTVVATNDGGSVTAPVSVSVTDNASPVFSDTIQTAINTANITSARGIGTITLTDPLSGISYENVEIDTFDGDSNFTISTETPAPTVTYQVSSSGAVAAGTYTLQFTGSDEYGNVVKTSKNVVVSTAAASPIQKNGNLFIIESAESGSHITTSTDGIPGTQVQFTTTTPGVTWSVSPTTYLYIDTTGKLSLQAHVSGVLDDTNTIDATVTAGTGAILETTLQISVDITPNLAPTVTDTVPATISDTVAVANATLGTITAIDPQALDSIDSIAITGGANQSEVTLGTFSQTTNSGSVDLKVGGSNMTAGAKAVQVTATDSFGQETVHNINFTVGATPATQVFIYTNTVNAANLNGTTTQALTALGALYYEQYGFADAGYALNQLSGSSDFAQDFTATGTTYGSGVLEFIASGSIDNLLDMQTFGNIPTSTTGKQVVYLFPSSSDMSSLPSTIAAVADLNNIPSGQHALVSYAQTPPVSPTGDVLYFTTANPVHGYSNWGIAFTLDRQTGTNRWAIAASGDTIPS